MLPFCQRTARDVEGVSLAEKLEEPTICPALLMAFAALPLSPGKVPKSLIAPFCHRNAWNWVSVLLGTWTNSSANPTT